MQLVLFNPYIGLLQVLPFRARVDLGAMAMKGCSAFPKNPRELTGGGGVLPLCRDTVDVFYSPN